MLQFGKFVVASLALVVATASAASAQTRAVAVLELFTSQGCSSCPPADRLFEKYAERKDIVALTLPVDYWDYLGWKDTLASPRYSQRQRRYAHARGDGAVYTPQVVVNGRAHAVGSHGSEIDTKIDQLISTVGLELEPVVRRVGDTLEIMVPAKPGSIERGSVTVWIASVQSKADVKIDRGENRGEALTYYNVVRNMSAVGMWSGKAETYHVPLHSVHHTSAEKCAILLQRGNGGPIIGAAWYGH